ncbi:hypothetical protein [Rossellomorea marisflavi]|uniref:hypothetical protein n=1 Tax=Rossellomorea marisflavi TaxID=189381 RepID=UPI003FA1620F
MSKPNMSEGKQERLNDCLDKYERAYEKLLNAIEENSFDESLLEIIEKIDSECKLRFDDLKDEVNYSNIG